jgi:16S rRNA (uracil1498-N3)-methyltransferase
MPALARVYVPGPIGPGPLSLPPDATRRLANVLRLKPGNAFLAFSGDGREYPAIIDHVGGKRLAATVQAIARQEPPPPLSIELYAGLVRANRFDLVVEKATEAGADVITPLLSERSARGEAPSDSRSQRWERIAIEASEQSGRLYLPVLQQPVSLDKVIERAGLTFLMTHHGEMPWREAAGLLPQRGSVALLVGPEGGFTSEEALLARQRGAILTSIGPNVLRTETAAIVATALVRSAALH